MTKALDAATKHRVGKLIKAFNAIRSHIQRGGTLKATRSVTLIDRYNTLRAEGQHTGAWRIFCETVNADTSHNGYDLFA